MINLLPPEHKTSVEKEYKFRLASAYILLISIAVFIGVVLLLPSYFFASTRVNVAKQELAILQSSSESTEREAINQKLLETKDRLADLTKTTDSKPVFELIDAVSIHKKADIDITQLSYTRSGEGGGILSVGGIALTRDALLNFKRGLEGDELFSEVVLPVSSLAEDENIKFNIQVTGIF